MTRRGGWRWRWVEGGISSRVPGDQSCLNGDRPSLSIIAPIIKGRSHIVQHPNPPNHRSIAGHSLLRASNRFWRSASSAVTCPPPPPPPGPPPCAGGGGPAGSPSATATRDDCSGSLASGLAVGADASCEPKATRSQSVRRRRAKGTYRIVHVHPDLVQDLF